MTSMLKKKTRNKRSKTNFRTRLREVWSFLLVINSLIFSLNSFGKDCEDKDHLRSIIQQKYDYNRISKKLTGQDVDILRSNYLNAVDQCINKLCKLIVNSEINDVGCRSLPTQAPWDSKNGGWNIKFNKQQLTNDLRRIKSAEQAAKECPDITNSYQKISDKHENLPPDKIKSVFAASKSITGLESLADNSCPISICKMLTSNWSYVMCGDRRVTPQEVKNLLAYHQLNNSADVSDGKNLNECRWAKKLPRRTITGCGACVGYVICKAPNKAHTTYPPNITRVDTMRLATCNPNNCDDSSAQACVDDPTVGSRNPNDDDEEEDATNVIQDQDLIKKASGQ